jgi:hypothetical protein
MIADGLLVSHLGQIARAENIKRLTGAPLAGGSDEGVGCELEIRLREGQFDRDGKHVVKPGPGGIHFYDGDRLILRARNPGREAIDLNLLYIDSNYGITCLFPASGEYNRLLAGQSVRLLATVSADTAGQEHLVLIAMRAKGEPLDLSLLEQPGLHQVFELPKTRSIRGSARSESPLIQWLHAAAVGGGAKTRGIARDDVPDYFVSLVSWNVWDRRRAPTGR